MAIQSDVGKAGEGGGADGQEEEEEGGADSQELEECGGDTPEELGLSSMDEGEGLEEEEEEEGGGAGVMEDGGAADNRQKSEASGSGTGRPKRIKKVQVSSMYAVQPLYKGTLKSDMAQQQPSLWSGSDYYQ